jgi:hypothetical protein
LEWGAQVQVINLEDHFKEVCSRHPHLKLLESQWRFDEELISKALQNVSSVFPHYSRHDASHSRQILVNIERMLGEKIKFLSATDTWLIMEAAYNHDIGMVITQRQLKDMDSESFGIYVRDVASQSEHPLNRFAIEWEMDQAKLPKGAASHSFLNKYIQLIAEWYRRKHPENSAKIVANPLDEIGLNSPRNELLPKRLFGVLAQVCQAHGQGFDDVLKLPFSEAGMAYEDCHPRYVACLLRMADLLDLDDNRFCPVMLEMCGDYLPEISRSHVDKHHSIKHFRLDSERIEAESECPTPESYEVAFEWFKWLENEYHQQTQHWDKIVPSKLLGNLPTLTTPSVTIKDPFMVLEKGKKPNFRVDQKAILDLVRSTGLYESKFESVREILQNAVDATLITVWMTHKAEIVNLNPIKPRLREIFDQYPIIVEFNEDPNDARFIILRVQDQGSGIDLNTLQYMLEVGGTYKNKAKRAVIDEMPVWYRPSGNFGIGLQSCFLISDKIIIKSKSRLTHEAFKLSLSKKLGRSVVIKRILAADHEYGTTLEMKIKIKKFPQSLELHRAGDNSVMAQKLNAYDFTKPGANLRFYETIKIYEAVEQFNVRSPIKIANAAVEELHQVDSHFCEKNNLILSCVRFTGGGRSRVNTFFRGQRFKGFEYLFHFLSATVDFYGYSAKDFLTYNREKILEGALDKARADVIAAVKAYIETKYDSIPDNQRPYAAAFYFLIHGTMNNDLENQLLNLPVFFSDGSTKLLRVVISELVSGALPKISTPGYGDETEVSPTKLDKRNYGPVLDIIMHFAKENGLHHQLVEGGSLTGGNTYQWSSEDCAPITERLFRQFLHLDFGVSHGVGSRILFPCWGKYRNLAIRAKISWARVFTPNRGYEDMMVLPCLFIKENGVAIFHTNEELAQWVYDNRKHQNLQVDQIFELYDELSGYLSSLI